MLENIETPKLLSEEKNTNRAWYPYYAGYSESFVQSVFDSLRLGEGSSVLDPWNGSGTTTTVAALNGIESVGVDLNPAIDVVARARSASPRAILRAKSVFPEVVAGYGEMDGEVDENDLLLRWFDLKSSVLLRKLSKYIRTSLNESDSILSREGAVLYLALFNSVSEFIRLNRTTNPSWIKLRGNHTLSIDEGTLIKAFASQIVKFARVSEGEMYKDFVESRIELADSRELSLRAKSHDLIIGSPPYCTRIDYAVATAVELAILGYNADELSELRLKLMGTTKVDKAFLCIKEEWGPECIKFLNGVRSHGSKASQGYYLKNHIRYFSDLFLSLSSSQAHLSHEGNIVIVVQDSYYKDIHNNLPKIVTQMLYNLNFDLVDYSSFESKTSMINLNKFNRNYNRKPPSEEVLFFRRSNGGF